MATLAGLEPAISTVTRLRGLQLPHSASGIVPRICPWNLRLRRAVLFLVELGRHGSPTRVRTWNIRVNSAALYRLSYRGSVGREDGVCENAAPLQAKSISSLVKVGAASTALARAEGFEPPTRGFGSRRSSVELRSSNGRDGTIRTCDHRVPNAGCCQAAPRPVKKLHKKPRPQACLDG